MLLSFDREGKDDLNDVYQPGPLDSLCLRQAILKTDTTQQNIETAAMSIDHDKQVTNNNKQITIIIAYSTW